MARAPKPIVNRQRQHFLFQAAIRAFAGRKQVIVRVGRLKDLSEVSQNLFPRMEQPDQAQAPFARLDGHALLPTGATGIGMRLTRNEETRALLRFRSTEHRAQSCLTANRPGVLSHRGEVVRPMIATG